MRYFGVVDGDKGVKWNTYLYLDLRKLYLGMMLC